MTSNENGQESVVDRMAGILEPETSQEQPKVKEEQPEVQQETEQPIEEVAQEETQESTALIDEAVEENEINEQEVEQPQTYRVKVQGEEVDVTLDELQKGYSRQADYVRKTQKLAEQRKEVENELSQLQKFSEKSAQYDEGLRQIEELLSQPDNQEDLQKLKQTNPQAYAIKLAERSEREQQKAKVQAERAKVQQEQQQLQQQQIQKHLKRETDILNEVLPEMKNPKTKQNIMQEIMKGAKKLNYTNEELSNVYDHRNVLTLLYASRYLALKDSQPEVFKKMKSAPKIMKAGVAKATSQTQSDKIKRAKTQLKRSGKVRDASKLFEQLL
tara:strand:+ start:6415 stop:7401 length:987 start_codon:yes stop_codon:yes gene_type:complete